LLRSYHNALTAEPSLNAGEIDIWFFSLNHHCPIAAAQLDMDEQERADRFYFQHHQQRFTKAHGTLRLILSRYVGEPAKALTFTKGLYGKPELCNKPELQFNLSHSGDYALLAVGSTHPLGIDLEQFSARPYAGIGEQLFSKAENQALRDAPKRLTCLTFFNIWSQKEAFIKASGLGLTYPTDQFDVPILSQTPHIIDDHIHHRSWKIMSFMPRIACCAALCYDPSIEVVRYYSLLND
jgi:4'-phosphopantetheinyl transferase